MTRTYQSALRAEQMEQTREKILEAVLALTNDDAADVTVASAADRAGVAVRTAYRYFPTLESLLDEFNAWAAKRLGGMRPPADLESLPRFIAELYEFFERNSVLFRATRGREKGVNATLRSRRKMDQRKVTEKTLAAVTRHMNEREAKKLCGVIHSLISFDNYWNLTQVWGLTTQESIETTVESVERLLAPYKEGR
jgi:AcrR family transcriptional regulator